MSCRPRPPVRHPAGVVSPVDVCSWSARAPARPAWEVAYAVVFLLSNEASYVTAQELVVDGALIYQAG